MRWHASPLPNENPGTPCGVSLFFTLNNLGKMINIISTGDMVRTIYKGKKYTFTVTEVLYAGGSMMYRNNHPDLPSLIRARDCAQIKDE